MSRNALVCVLLAAAATGPAGAGCSDGATPEPVRAELFLSRSTIDRVEVRIRNSGAAPRAVQATLAIDSPSAYLFEEVTPGTLDSVRLQARGTNRAILFVADKRGMRLTKDGTLVSFIVRPVSSAEPGTITIEDALIADETGARIETDLGTPISVR